MSNNKPVSKTPQHPIKQPSIPSKIPIKEYNNGVGECVKVPRNPKPPKK